MRNDFLTIILFREKMSDKDKVKSFVERLRRVDAAWRVRRFTTAELCLKMIVL